jgi:outer membrane receptor protein involved in Fe transport
MLDGQLRVNGAVFYEDYTDKQTNVQKIIGNILGSVTANADGGEATGFEIDVAYAMTDKLTLSGGYTYLDTEYTDYVSYSRSAGEIARDGTCVRVEDYLGSGDQYCMIDRSGNEFERAPKNAATLNLMYEDEIQLGPQTGIFFVELSSRFQGKRFIDNSNDAYVQDYWRFDLRTGISSGPWDAVLYVNNLLDDDTVLSAGTGPDIGNSDFRFGMVMTFVQHSVRPYPGGPVVATYSMPDVTGQYGSSDGLVSIVPAPMIRNMWYANMPDPRQIGMRVSYSFK